MSGRLHSAIYQDSHMLLPVALYVRRTHNTALTLFSLNHEIFLTSSKVERRIQQTPEVPITQLKKQHNKCTLIPLEHVLILSFLSPFFPVVTSILQLYFYSMYILILSLHISYLSSIYSIGLYILKLSIESCYIKYISFHDLLFKIIII